MCQFTTLTGLGDFQSNSTVCMYILLLSKSAVNDLVKDSIKNKLNNNVNNGKY